MWHVWLANSMDQGSGWDSFWGGPARKAFSFTLGLWLYRIRDKAPRLRLGWIVVSVDLAALFAKPLMPASVLHSNGLYEAIMVASTLPPKKRGRLVMALSVEVK